jgi:hypothetical protein
VLPLLRSERWVHFASDSLPVDEVVITHSRNSTSDHGHVSPLLLELL